jgi:AcrR family transcriptional regulator
MEKVAESRAEQGERTRERIIDAAARLFVRKGYAATSIADLASAVEMTKGALYHHFDGKEAIFSAVLETIRATWSRTVAKETLVARNARDRLGALLDSQARFLQANESFCILLSGLMTELEESQPELHAALQKVYGELVRFIEQIVRKGQEAGEIRSDLDARLTALSIVGTIRGTACSRPLAERRTIDYPEIMGAVKKVVLKGLEP